MISEKKGIHRILPTTGEWKNCSGDKGAKESAARLDSRAMLPVELKKIMKN